MTKETRLDGGRPVLPDEMMPPGVAPPRDRTPHVAKTDGTDFRPVGRVAAEVALRIAWRRRKNDASRPDDTQD
jgi:hypothetical protein